MADREHQKGVAQFAAQHLTQRRGGGDFVPDRFPDEEERDREAVDLLGHDAVGPMAVEHTTVEAYATQVHDNIRFWQLFERFATRFDADLPRPGHYVLGIDLGSSAAARGDLEALCDEVEAWVWRQAPQLPEPRLPVRGANSISAELGEQLSATLYRLGDRPDEEGSLRVALHGPPSIERGRAERMRTALQDKAPKLELGRPEGGTTLLVLESRDFVFSNPVVIAQAVRAAAEGFAPLPDEIVLVDTSAGWNAHAIKSGSNWSAAALDLPPAP